MGKHSFASLESLSSRVVPDALRITLPQNVLYLDGSQAFTTWEGGLIGVLIEQLNDFGEFHKQWHLDDLTR